MTANASTINVPDVVKNVDLGGEIDDKVSEGDILDPENHVIGKTHIIPIPLRQASAEFNLTKHLLELMQAVPFFATISRWVRKIPTYSIPTAGVTHNPKTDELTMYYNPLFFLPMPKEQVRGVLVHEFYHLIFGHVTTRRREPHGIWNIATDLAINSIILGQNKGHLPLGCLVPGELPVKPDGRALTKEEMQAQGPIAEAIAKFPKNMASEWYFERIMDVCKENGIDFKMVGMPGGAGGGQDGIGTMDDHGMWESLTEEERERVTAKVKGMIEKAAKNADQTSSGWGDIPHEIREEIRASVSNLVDWRTILRQFVGFCLRGDRAKTMKRINRRYPYVHPGTKRGYMAKLLVAVDQSGSVSDQALETVAGELSSMAQQVQIDVVPFDTQLDEKDMITWRKGQRMADFKRTRCGGTDFNAPTRYVNEEKAGYYDGLLIVTDGECGEPVSCNIKRAYVLVPGSKMYHQTQDLVISMDEKKGDYEGAWR